GRAKYRDGLHWQGFLFLRAVVAYLIAYRIPRRQIQAWNITASGTTGISASMRSSTPPCPGKRWLLSLTPARRFNCDSTRSPITLAAVRTVKASASPVQPQLAASRAGKVPASAAVKAQATPAASTRSQPPTAPSHDFPGEMLGASLRLP